MTAPLGQWLNVRTGEAARWQGEKAKWRKGVVARHNQQSEREKCRVYHRPNSENTSATSHSGQATQRSPVQGAGEPPPAISFSAVAAPNTENATKAEDLSSFAPTNKSVASFDNSGAFAAFGALGTFGGGGQQRGDWGVCSHTGRRARTSRGTGASWQSQQHTSGDQRGTDHPSLYIGDMVDWRSGAPCIIK